MNRKKVIVCLASFEKGFDFMRECHAQGWRVILITGESLRDAAWPRDVLEDVFFVPDPDKQWNTQHLVYAVAYLARKVEIDRIVALDDFDVEKAAAVREHIRIEGMGETTARNFRDKLAMRGRAADAGIAVPPFCGVLNYDRLARFMQEVPPPYVLKPRLQANAIGIQKINHPDGLWPALDRLGDEQSFFVLEKFVEGDICHVDSIIKNNKVVFACASRYGTPPMEVFHGGRVFTTRTLEPTSDEAKALFAVNQQVMTGLGLRYGVSHTEFIAGKDGEIYFLETSARVGGAHIADMVEAATGISLWREWAKLETAENLDDYKVKAPKKHHAALLNTLAQQTWPDMSGYNAPEVVWTMKKKQHAGLIVASKSYDRVGELLDDYTRRFYQDFFAALPAAETASQMA